MVSMAAAEMRPYSFVALGPMQTLAVQEDVPKVTCILCMEESEIRLDRESLVLPMFVQR